MAVVNQRSEEIKREFAFERAIQDAAPPADEQWGPSGAELVRAYQALHAPGKPLTRRQKAARWLVLVIIAIILGVIVAGPVAWGKLVGQ